MTKVILFDKLMISFKSSDYADLFGALCPFFQNILIRKQWDHIEVNPLDFNIGSVSGTISQNFFVFLQKRFLERVACDAVFMDCFSGSEITIHYGDSGTNILKGDLKYPATLEHISTLYHNFPKRKSVIFIRVTNDAYLHPFLELLKVLETPSMSPSVCFNYFEED